MLDAWLSGLVAGYGIAIPIGAIAVLIVSLAAQTSFRIGAAAGLGAATADLTYATIATTTGYGLRPELEHVAFALRLAGAAVLMGLAIHGLIGAWRAKNGGDAPAAVAVRRPARTYAVFLGLTMLNPLTVVYFAALVVGRQASVANASSAIAFVIGVFMASLSWQTLLAGVGAALHRTSLGASRFWTGVLGNTIIVALAIRLAVFS